MATHYIQKEFGNAIRLRRQQLGLTQVALAARADMHRTYLSDIERGFRNVSLRNIALLAKALEIPIADLFQPQLRTTGRS